MYGDLAVVIAGEKPLVLREKWSELMPPPLQSVLWPQVTRAIGLGGVGSGQWFSKSFRQRSSV